MQNREQAGEIRTRHHEYAYKRSTGCRRATTTTEAAKRAFNDKTQQLMQQHVEEKQKRDAEQKMVLDAQAQQSALKDTQIATLKAEQTQNIEQLAALQAERDKLNMQQARDKQASAEQTQQLAAFRHAFEPAKPP